MRLSNDPFLVVIEIMRARGGMSQKPSSPFVQARHADVLWIEFECDDISLDTLAQLWGILSRDSNSDTRKEHLA